MKEKNTYVEKRKRRRIIAYTASISVIGLSVLTLVAFLGRRVGTFTVSLNTSDIQLSLSKSSTFTEPTSFLRVEDVPAFEEYTYGSLPEDEEIDNENSSTYMGAVYEEDGTTIAALNYFKYTFFLKNVGEVAADYTFSLNYTDNNPATDGSSLLDTLRVLLYETDVTSSGETTVNRIVYASPSTTTHTLEDGSTTTQEYISTEEYGFATSFATENPLFTLKTSQFLPSEMKRYTLVTWLEGFDPQSEGNASTFKDATVQLGVSIHAQQSETTE